MSVTATVIDFSTRAARAAERTRATLRAVRDYRGLRHDTALAAATGIPRTKVQRLGPTAEAADALGVEVTDGCA